MSATVIPFPLAYADRVAPDPAPEPVVAFDPDWHEPAWTDPECDCRDCIHDAQQAALRASPEAK